jgi:hypothetical protein
VDALSRTLALVALVKLLWEEEEKELIVKYLRKEITLDELPTSLARASRLFSMDGNMILYQGVNCLPAKDMPSFVMAHHDLFGHMKSGPVMDTLVKDWRWPRWAFPLRIKESEKAVSCLWKLVCDYACVRYPIWLFAVRRRGAHSGTCSVNRLSTNPKYEKRYHLKPPMILEKNVGYNDLTTCFLQLNPILLDTITSDLTKVRGLRNPMTYRTPTHDYPQGR